MLCVGRELFVCVHVYRGERGGGDMYGKKGRDSLWGSGGGGGTLCKQEGDL